MQRHRATALSDGGGVMAVETTDSLTITLPVPDSNTGGNARGHWSRVYKARKRVAKEAKQVCNSERVKAGVREETWSPVNIIIDWYGWNHADRDNIASRCKPILDGIVHAGLIPDDGPQHVRSVQVRRVEVDRKDPRVEITVERLETDAD